MEITDSDKDRFVVLTLKPNWGRGKIRVVKEGKAYIVFENDEERIERKYPLYSEFLHLAENQDPTGFKGIVKRPPSNRSMREPKTPVRHELSYLVETFKTRYLGGFEDKTYREDMKKGERAYKEAAIHYFKEWFLDDGKIKKAVEDKNTTYLREHTEKIINNKINLLHITEKYALLDALKNEEYSLELFSALIKVLNDPEIRQDTMGPYLEVFNHGPVDGLDKWTISTLYTYLANPEKHMFLKPEATKRFADAVGWELNYETQPNWRTYSSLLGMTQKYLEELKPYGAKDIIDFQSFIWVVHSLMKEPKVKKTPKIKQENQNQKGGEKT